jgi:hypothetical protein
MVLGYFGFGHIIYVSLLFTNAIAILNEERFLAKSEFDQCHLQGVYPLESADMLPLSLTPTAIRVVFISLSLPSVPLVSRSHTR